MYLPTDEPRELQLILGPQPPSRQRPAIRGFAPLPTAISRDPSLSNGAVRLYSLLQTYAWQDGVCFPGQQRLADDMGKSVATVKRYLSELVACGLIVRTRRGLNKTNLYRLPRLEAPTAKSNSNPPNIQLSGELKNELSRELISEPSSGLKNELLRIPSYVDSEDEETPPTPPQAGGQPAPAAHAETARPTRRKEAPAPAPLQRRTVESMQARQEGRRKLAKAAADRKWFTGSYAMCLDCGARPCLCSAGAPQDE